ncbi:MAG: hypothetical protein ABJB12_06440 [Pseudomonadota bacterium]
MRAHLADFRVNFGCCVACAACLTACTPAERGPFAGASDSSQTASRVVPAAAAPPPTPWAPYAEAQTWPLANGTPFTSRGHQPEQQVDVRANEVARQSYAALVTDSVFPEGSVLLEQAHSASGGGLGYAMRKSSGRWSFIQLDARGGVLASGALALCAGCHAQAPADHVFGLPRAS